MLGMWLWLAPAVAVAGPAKARGALELNARTGMATPSFEQLVRAVKQRDRGATERLAGRMGPGRLALGLTQPDRRVVLAVLAALPGPRGALLLTEPVANLTLSPDAAIAGAAARVLGELLGGDDPGEYDLWEIPADVIERGCAALRALAARPGGSPVARLPAIAALGGAASCPERDVLLPALRDPDPTVRRAAILGIFPRSAAALTALREATRDPARPVAAAALARLCHARAVGVAGAMAAGVAEAARMLIVAPATAPEDAVEMLACLSPPTPADAPVLDQLRRGSPSPLRDRAVELIESSAASKAP
jgi:hypothetical protein